MCSYNFFVFSCGHGVVVYFDDIERCDSRPVGTIEPAGYDWLYPTQDLCPNAKATYAGVSIYDCEDCEEDDDLKVDAVCSDYE